MLFHPDFSKCSVQPKLPTRFPSHSLLTAVARTAVRYRNGIIQHDSERSVISKVKWDVTELLPSFYFLENLEKLNKIKAVKQRGMLNSVCPQAAQQLKALTFYQCQLLLVVSQ